MIFAEADATMLTELTRIMENESGGKIVDELQALRDQIDEMLTVLSEEEGASDE